MVADPRHHRHALLGLALIGLTLLVHYAWAWFPAEAQARIWNACGAMGRLVLLLALVWRVRSRLVIWCALWWACEELLTIGCSLAFLYVPWVIPAGEAQCSSLLQLDLGTLGRFAAAVLLVQAVKSYRSAIHDGGR